MLEHGFVHADLHLGSMVVQDEQRLVLFVAGLAKLLHDGVLIQFIDMSKCLAMGTPDDLVGHLKRFHSSLIPILLRRNEHVATPSRPRSPGLRRDPAAATLRSHHASVSHDAVVWYGRSVVAPRYHHFDFDDYLRVEDDSDIKHEFVDGQVWAMAGGTPEHARIIANISTLLNVALGDRRCDVFSSELRIRVRAVNRATYPDVSVICDHIELDPEDPKGHTALNPTVLVEVLSPPTAEYDQGEKLDYYKQIPSLQEVMLVHHDARRVVVWRHTGSSWSACEHTDVVELGSIGCKLAVAKIYRGRLT